MRPDLKVPILSYAQIAERAATFLRRYHPAGTIPVPIEEIVDVHLKIDIIPTPSLRRAFEVDAFLSCDMASIYVDDDVYNNVSTRLMFSLCHEVAHAVLHQNVYRSFGCGGSIEEWKRIQESIPDDDYKWLEFHANAFAGLVLVPPAALKAEFESVQRKLRERNSVLPRPSDMAKQYLARVIARQFEVSPEVVSRRIEKDSLWPAECLMGRRT